jgi:predicted PhzF superfamily epimerase YddE/YHI9
MSVNTGLRVQRVAAFSDGDSGGNPAGVVIERQLPDEPTMRQIAREVGFSECVMGQLSLGRRLVANNCW